MKSTTVHPRKPKEIIRYASIEELWEKKHAKMQKTLNKVDPEQLKKLLTKKA